MFHRYKLAKRTQPPVWLYTKNWIAYPQHCTYWDLLTSTVELLAGCGKSWPHLLWNMWGSMEWHSFNTDSKGIIDNCMNRLNPASFDHETASISYPTAESCSKSDWWWPESERKWNMLTPHRTRANSRSCCSFFLPLWSIMLIWSTKPSRP